MLTYVHMLVYTLWCGHTLRMRWSLKGRERTLLRKWSAYFLLRRWKIWRSRGSDRTLAMEASDAESVRPVCCQCLAQLGLGTGCQAPDVGLTLFVHPVWLVLSRASLTESTGHSGCIWCSASGDRASLQTSLCIRPVFTRRIWCQLNRVRCFAGDR